MYIKFNSTSVYMQWTSTIVTVSMQLYTHCLNKFSFKS